MATTASEAAHMRRSYQRKAATKGESRHIALA